MNVKKNNHSKVLFNNSTKTHSQKISYNKVQSNNSREFINDSIQDYESDQDDDVTWQRNPSHNLLSETISTKRSVPNNKEINRVILYLILCIWYFVTNISVVIKINFNVDYQ